MRWRRSPSLLPEGTVLITGAVRPAEPVTPRRHRAPTIQSMCSIMTARSLDLRQGPSRAVRRIPAVPEIARAHRAATAHQAARRLSSPATAAALLDVPGAPRCAADLLRDHFSGRRRAVPRPAETRPGLAASISPTTAGSASAGPYQHFQQARVPRDRGRSAAGARRQYRYFRRHRSARPRRRSLPLGAEGVLDAPLPRADCPARPMPAVGDGSPPDDCDRAVVVLHRRLQPNALKPRPRGQRLS